ncbi:alcohol dehydrogenase catalytic domain-containing protein [Candidatus Bathyarchaeota archaeon]|nr:alcohol dehydrogenase catalytic domain-containing protein [Candidatus Bathyarchaeota archaeon]
MASSEGSDLMKAILLDKTGPIEQNPLRYSDYDCPELSRDEVLIKIRSCGVCRSNLNVIEGVYSRLGIPSKSPIIPGHEIIGVVEEAGVDVGNLAVGDRVGIQPLYSACGRCEFCLSGREHLCPTRLITGETVDGGYAEYIKGKADFVYLVPRDLKDDEAAPLFCPGVTAYRAVKQAGLFPSKTVAIFGIGGVGHVAVQFAKMTGATVVAISRNRRNLDLALRLGADRILTQDDNLVSEMKNIGYADSAIVFAPSQEAIDRAQRITKPGGTIVLGVSGDIKNLMFFFEKTIKGTAIGTRLDMREVLQIASAGKIKIFTQTFPLSQAQDALRKLKQGEIEGRAVLLP